MGCWYAYQQKKNSQKHLRRMMQDMEGLHKAELALENLQVSLSKNVLSIDSVTKLELDVFNIRKFY